MFNSGHEAASRIWRWKFLLSSPRSATARTPLPDVVKVRSNRRTEPQGRTEGTSDMTQRWTHRPDGSNWGDFGPDDELGRLHLLTPERVMRATEEIGRKSVG